MHLSELRPTAPRHLLTTRKDGIKVWLAWSSPEKYAGAVVYYYIFYEPKNNALDPIRVSFKIEFETATHL